MSARIIKIYWLELKEKLKQKWGNPTDYELMEASEELSEALQKAYGYEKNKTQREIKKLVNKNH